MAGSIFGPGAAGWTVAAKQTCRRIIIQFKNTLFVRRPTTRLIQTYLLIIIGCTQIKKE